MKIQQNTPYKLFYQRLLATTLGVSVIFSSSALARSTSTSTSSPSSATLASAIESSDASLNSDATPASGPDKSSSDKLATTDEAEASKADQDDSLQSSREAVESSEDLEQPESTTDTVKSDPVETEASTNPKGERDNPRTPQPIEPFIEADAIAIGKWLVVQKLQALSDNTLTPTAASSTSGNPTANVANKANTAQRAQTSGANTRTASNQASTSQSNASR